MPSRVAIRFSVAGATLLLGAALALSLPGATAARQGATKRHHAATRLPAQRPLYWGAWIGSQLTGTPPPWDMSAASRFAEIVGKAPSVVEFSSPFAECGSSACAFTRFPAAEMQAVRDYGAIPMFSWGSQATPAASLDQPDFQLSDLAAGAYDGYIRRFAEEARAWGQPFLLRFDWEPNGNWFVWDEGVNGNSKGEFVAAWRHVHDIFTSVGATNATWVWCLYADPQHRFGSLRSFYPGSSYVDWTCLDGYNWGKAPVNPHPWMSFDKIFSTSYSAIVGRIAPHKPLMLGEIATNGSGRKKAIWMRQMFSLLARKYRRVRGLVWFDQYDRGIPWPIETSPLTIRAFARGVHNRAYRTNLYASLATGPIPPPR